MERDEWRCQKCGSIENLQIHHKIKRSQRGNDSPENLVTLCAYCHMGEHAQLFYSSSSDQNLQQAKISQEVKPISRVYNHLRQRFWPPLTSMQSFCSGHAPRPIRACFFCATSRRSLFAHDSLLTGVIGVHVGGWSPWKSRFAITRNLRMEKEKAIVWRLILLTLRPGQILRG